MNPQDKNTALAAAIRELEMAQITKDPDARDKRVMQAHAHMLKSPISEKTKADLGEKKVVTELTLDHRSVATVLAALVLAVAAMFAVFVG